jgi:hypothetical protein
MSDSETKPITFQDLPELRRKTDVVSKFLHQQLSQHLETLRPLLAADRVFGKHAGGKAEVTGAERSLIELQQHYRQFTNKPYDLPRDFETQWLTLVGTALELYPWDHEHVIQDRTIMVASPVQWVVNFQNNYTLAQVRKVLVGKEAVRLEYLRQFVVNALVLQLLLARSPRLVTLLADLGYEVKTQTPAEFKGLPVVTLSSCLKSFRPADDLILAATAFSGLPGFVELINLDSIQTPKDALKEKLAELMK